MVREFLFECFLPEFASFADAASRIRDLSHKKLVGPTGTGNLKASSLPWKNFFEYGGGALRDWKYCRWERHRFI